MPQDQGSTNAEERVASALHELARLEQLSRHPELARTGTELARRLNTGSMARFNSGLGSKLGIFEKNGNLPVYPGSSTTTDRRSYNAVFPPGDLVPSPGSALLARYLDWLEAGTTDADCTNPTFNEALLRNCIDNKNGGLSDAELMSAARALKLDTSRRGS